MRVRHPTNVTDHLVRGSDKMTMNPFYIHITMFKLKYKVDTKSDNLIIRFVIAVVFYEITSALCVYRSNTTIFVGRI